ncbi:hypothetical protein LAZ67_1006496 [Cordylochernes scorpioides]|uniref:Ig-like domain-containing protein n=1 Tax=Cordylochernes scorpioides TaxID=51811 RepID=A0ABY6JZI0_9ARAC|nr:hypothetical protein LAZ67_1006496 [Cordylochernes scorpioides]
MDLEFSALDMGSKSLCLPMLSPSYSVPPQWKHEPTDKSAVMGHQVIFDCQASGFPDPVIRWKKAVGEYSFGSSILPNHEGCTLMASLPHIVAPPFQYCPAQAEPVQTSPSAERPVSS